LTLRTAAAAGTGPCHGVTTPDGVIFQAAVRRLPRRKSR